MNDPKPNLAPRIPSMKSQEKRIDKLKQVLERLSRGEIVQNRQLKTVLGAEGYARYCYDYREQTQLRDVLANKPKVITEYERRLKAATFAYSKADSKSVKGQHKTAHKMFNYTDGLFERLAEYLSEKIAGDLDLEAWFDRAVETTPENSFGLDPDSFPKIITSRSLNNAGGGHLVNKRTIREVKMDAVKAILEELTAPEADDSANVNERMARLEALMKRASD
jgi:hypothetical protein